MRCNIHGCPGHYELKSIVHTVKRGPEVLVFEDVPAEVCDVCSDIRLSPETIRHIENLMAKKTKPRKHAPVYLYV